MNDESSLKNINITYEEDYGTFYFSLLGARISLK